MTREKERRGKTNLTKEESISKKKKKRILPVRLKASKKVVFPRVTYCNLSRHLLTSNRCPFVTYLRAFVKNDSYVESVISLEKKCKKMTKKAPHIHGG